ncbi:MAG: hypothetical protein A3B23_02930 [Candidatus Colwellbacteria bacterium RIFCSPLOWO2_01_FULL_48_10]|uniref:Response regulatory domain-containing protein n=1 Tax=Candidatus Colwellbacteria bacterium RIFCSPLOWO2_01_FULL_48_10 TaxID=1797690 RepID=A0A1G1Z5V1_9BACT|nr:MAG: hypothetical protein A3B23_02930 [Candidatus Colwellbacteria bacterium RIFCSPLOWO2_01_FULL_48_10]
MNDNHLPKILIVDDEQPLQRALQAKFELSGFEVAIAVNGEAGLASALKNHPDVILLDIVMPKMDGMTMLHKLREDAWGRNAKVIFLTNLSTSEKVTEAVSNRVFDYLVKSDWKIESVVDKVRMILGIKPPTANQS